MGDIIDFPTGKRQEGFQVEIVSDPQVLLEKAIVKSWNKMEGHDMITNISQEDYLLGFLQFADICFSAMQDDYFKVDEAGKSYIHPDIYDELKEHMNAIRLATKPPTSNN